MSREKWPPLSPGTIIVTTKPNEKLRDQWSDGVWEKRQWNAVGKIETHHDSHGLSYEVRHRDGSIGHYDPSELAEETEVDQQLTEWSNKWAGMMRQIHEEDLYQVMGLMYYGATLLVLAQALGVSVEEARRRTLRVVEIISQHEPPEFMK